MKKLYMLLGAILCATIMDQPKQHAPTTVNNYFVKSGGCGGHCGGKCSCGKH